MGLDMYLRKKKYIGKAKIKVNILENDYEWYKNIGQEYTLDNCSVIEQEVGYWRKANAIHKWFVDNCQDGIDECQETWVSKESLKKLLDLCKEVKEKAILKDGKIVNGHTLTEKGWEPILEEGKYIENAEEIADLLPTTDGCFFGSTDYDEYYMTDILNTIDIIENILKEEDKDVDYYYQSSW